MKETYEEYLKETGQEDCPKSWWWYKVEVHEMEEEDAKATLLTEYKKRRENDKMKFTYEGFNGNEYPSYRDEEGKLWLDINNGAYGVKVDLHRATSDDRMLAGEPDFPATDMYQEKNIILVNEFHVHPRKGDYMLLDRLRSDCNYFLGNGNGYEGHLWADTVEEHIKKMKEIYNSFSKADKPQWLTMEQIEEYERKMLKKRKEREERA